jgi:hypothetical protein
MRTKTLALSAVLSALGTASLVAQTNVYSLNAVGYINVTMPPGFSIVTCPLIVGTDPANPTVTNDLNVVFPNTAPAAPYAGALVYQFVGGSYTAIDIGNSASYSGGWTGGGTVTLLPGQAVFFQNNGSANMTATFVGTVPQGSLTNALIPGYNLVGSIVPVSGDLVTNSIAAFSTPTYPNSGDFFFFFNPTTQKFANEVLYNYGVWSGGTGVNGDPVTTSVSEGFFYYNASGPAGSNTHVTEKWVENFTINP